MELRPYQKKAIEEIRAHFAAGRKKVLLHLATGGGKTHIFSYVIKQASERAKRSIMIVRGRKLVDQASKRLFHEHVPHGIRMAGHWNKNYSARVQVCSVDTLISRRTKEGLPEAVIVVIDEAHMATSEGYRTIIDAYPDAFFLSVTATPYTQRPLSYLADAIVHPITMQELIDQGHLCGFRYFAPSAPDLRWVKIDSKSRDYDKEGLERVMDTAALSGDIIEHWRKLAENTPTLCFAVSIKHSKHIVERFKEAGIAAEHCDADTPDGEREKIIERLQNGITKIISNVGIFCTGIDIPCLRTIIMARPTQSYNLFIQQCGRGTRLFPDKQHCLLLDHAGNLLKHGFPTQEPEVDLDGKINRATESPTNSAKVCPKCFSVYDRTQNDKCPACEHQEPVKKIKMSESDEQLEEIVVTSKTSIEQSLDHLKLIAKKRGYKQGWVWHKFIEKWGDEAAGPFLPEWWSSPADPFAMSPFKGRSR